ncbi:MAG: DUF3944 domain-containing protein [Bacteroidaceae bacterium]|nr:DUF3944 domain-containing protein [Bacteroidaceae bacterium]
MRKDEDLEFLKFCKNDDLKILTDYLVFDENGKKRISEQLTSKKVFHENYPHNIPVLWEEIANELQLYGGNTLLNVIRKQGVTYREILCDVCDRMKVNYNKDASIELIETCFLQKVMLDSLEQMSVEDMQEVIQQMEIKTQTFTKQGLTAALQIAIRTGGFAPYKMAVIVANAVAKALLGRGLSLALNASLTKTVSIFAGPIGWAVTVLWTLVDIAGPAYRVTIPAVAQIIYMRHRSQMLLE